MKHRRNVLWLASALVLTLLPAAQPAEAQTASIPLDTLDPAPPSQSGTLSNGVQFSVDNGFWFGVTPATPTPFYAFCTTSPCSTGSNHGGPQTWTFDQPVALRFGITNLQIQPNESVQLPPGSEPEFIHPNHSWDSVNRIIGPTPNTTVEDESTFTHPGTDELMLTPVGPTGIPQALRGTSFIEVTPLSPAIALEKSGDGPDPLEVGATIDYSFLVTNTGNTELTEVTVTDPLDGMSLISCPGDTLAPDAEMTCTSTYTVTQEDVDAGVVENTATVTGQPPFDLPQVSDESSAMVPPTQTPGIALDKTGSGPDPLTVGANVDYTFVVTNTGNVTLSNVTVTDPLDGMSPISCPGDTLAPSDEMTCTANYTVTQQDADNGVIENTATATGDPPSGPSVSDEDFAVVPPSQKPGISIAKSGSGPDPLEVGATIDYSFVVTNTGNVTLSDVTVTDPLPGLSPIDCPESTLAPSTEMTCTATYTVTQDDVDAGVVENTATVTGETPTGGPPPTDESTTTVPPTGSSGISIEKSGSGPDPLTVGATIDYTFVVTNTGNVTLTNVVVTDPLPGLSPIDCPSTALAPGAEMTCTATYEVTQADVEAGVVENTATVTGETPTGGPPPTDESTTTVPPIPPVPSLPSLAFILLMALLATSALWTLRRARA